MFQSTRKTMKWGSLIKDLKEKVGLSHSPSSPTLSSTFLSSSDRDNAYSDSVFHDFAPSSSREKCVLELDFKRYWEEFRTSSSEKEKEAALNLTIDSFCRLVKQHANVAQLLTMLVETHIFSFVVGRAFVTDIGKLKITSKTRSLDSENVLRFFSEVTKDGFCPGSNLLNAVEILVSEPIDKQSLLDSGILCCLIHVLNSLLGNVASTHKQDASSNEDLLLAEIDHKWASEHARLLEIEGSVVHIMKALASQPSAALTLIEDESLQLLFNMVAKGSLTVFAQYKDGLVPLHTIQLHRHAMQILGLLLANDNGSTAKYIRKHQLIRVLLMAVKDFVPDSGDSAYTMGIVDLLLECVELSYRPEAGITKLREDIHNAHGYHFIVQFALTLSNMPRNHGFQYFYSKSSSNEIIASDDSHGLNDFAKQDLQPTGDSSSHLLPTLCRLLDVLVNLSQTGPPDSTGSGVVKGSKSTNPKSGGHGRSSTSSSEKLADDFWEKGNSKVKDLEGVQMLQDIFLKAESRELQAEVLNRMFKIFSSHLENYRLCQQLRTVPLFILNMAGFPQSLQEIILKILEYAVTVVNCIPEQELLSLCCLLQQPVSAELKRSILFFFVKLLSFDQQYKKILREVGVLEVLLDDLKQHKFLLDPEQNDGNSNQLDRKSSSSNFKIHLDSKDAIISSPKLIDSGSGKLLLFEVEETVAVAWDCLVSLLKKAEANQASFRAANGVTIILPFLESEVHRPGVLRIMSCLIIEDLRQVHSEELGALVEVLKSGMVTSVLGSQYKLQNDAKCDILGALWRILGVNNSSQRVFGEVTGFSLLLTILHSFQSAKETQDSACYIRLFTYLFRVVTAGVSGNAVNRIKLHEIISSQTFYDLLLESHLLCLECEEQVTQLFLELALELVLSPFVASESTTSQNLKEDMCVGFIASSPCGPINPDKEWVCNAGAVRVLIQSLLFFTPKMQLEILNIIQKLAFGGPVNQEALTSVGCVELLLETIQPFLLGSSSPILSNSLKVLEVLGSYRLSTIELRMLTRFILQMRLMKSGQHLVNMMERLILMEDMSSDEVPLAPFVQMDLSLTGHASVQVSLGERLWPPAAGYSFVCWFQFRNFLKPQGKEIHPSKNGKHYKTRNTLVGQHHGEHVLRIFSVGAVDKNTFYAELYIQEDGTLILATSNSSCLSFSGLELVEGRWHHLAIVHSKPNALAGLFQSSVAYVYLDGRMRQTGKLGYSSSPFGKSLQVTIGTPDSCAKVSDLSWKLRCCYLFEEVLTPGSICFMYILGKGYRGIFQDTNLLSFVPNQACAGGSMAILESLDVDLPSASNLQRLESTNKQGKPKAERSGIVWDMEILGDISLQLSGKRLIFAFDGTCTEFSRSSGVFSMINLVDPMSAAASPIGGIPRFGRLHGDIYVCRQCVIGDTILPIGGMAVVLALVEAAETCDMLHMALTLLACALHQNPRNVSDMQTYRGYHLLSLFLFRRISLFDMHCLEIFFQIAACEASFSEPKNLGKLQSLSSPAAIFREATIEDLSLSKISDDFSSAGSHGDMDDIYEQKDAFSHFSELETTNLPAEISNCIVLSNPDMVEHVLLDWTLWVISPISIQIALLGFLEHLVSMHWYRNHNLTILRRINLVQHLLVTLQRGDVEIPVLEKLVVLLGVILEDGFLSSELEHVVRFVIMTFDPAVLRPRHEISRESMGKHVIVRNMLLEMLIDLQVTIKLEELLEQWHKIVSSKLITYFLDEGVHPTSMRWIMTLLGVCLAASPTFVIKFRTSGGYQGLARVLRSFYDSPDIYYILFRLIFGKSVYPRLPEVRMLDFHALIPSDGHCGELKFVDLLESVIAMAKSTFERLSVQSMLAYETGSLSQASAGFVAELVEENSDTAGELQGEALLHKTYAARLMGGQASAPAAATSLLRFMVDLAKMCHPFSVVCRRGEFLESCIDLYFSCARAAFALKMTKELTVKSEEKDLNKFAEPLSGLTLEEEQSVNTSLGGRCFPEMRGSMNSEDLLAHQTSKAGAEDAENILVSQYEPDTSVPSVARNLDNESIDEGPSTAFNSNGFNFHNNNSRPEPIHLIDSQSLTSLSMLDSPILSDKSNTRMYISPISSPVVALTSWLGSGHHDESKLNLASTPSMESPVSVSVSEFDQSSEMKYFSQGSATNTFFSVNSKVLLEIDDSAYGGGPCSAAANAVLDFVAEVLSNFMTEQIKAAPSIESILEIVPLHVDTDCVLVFQGLCLGRLMNFLERRLLRDDEENFKRLDKSRWSSNLDTFCWMTVDRVYMGAFPQPSGVLKILEFLLSMLQLANKDGRIEEAMPTGKGLLSIGRGNRQLDAYIHSLLKNTNRMIMYCFLPSFLVSIGEDVLLSHFGLQIDSKKNSNSPQDDARIDICTFLQLLVAHKEIIFCPSNLDTDLNCCLSINLTILLHDQRKHAQQMAVDIFRYMLVHRRAGLEDLLVSKQNQGQHLGVLHGFDRLLTGSLPDFFEWLCSSQQTVNKVLEQCAAIMWSQYIAGSAKFLGVRLKSMESRRKKEMGRRSRDISKLDLRHWEQINERRYALEVVRDAMSTELRVVRQDKFGWVLHAESEWQTHLQQLVHERGIFPMFKTSELENLEWQLCPIEGPYRMRKKLERCKLKIGTIQSVLDRLPNFGEVGLPNVKSRNSLNASDTDSDPFSRLLTDKAEHNDLGNELYDESFFNKTDDVKRVVTLSSGWNDDLGSSMNEGSLHSALDFGGKSSTFSAPLTESAQGRSDLGSPRQSSVKIDDAKIMEGKVGKDLNDNGEYLIRPYLEPFEKIKSRFNCERVVGLDKHDGIFLIGELSLYVIENFYVDGSGCICEKEYEDELSIIDQALGVKKDVSSSFDFPSKSTSFCGVADKANVGGRAWAYNGGAWGKEKVCSSSNLPHLWRMWKLSSVHEILKRDYQLRPVAIEIFSMDGCNDLLVFHKREREEVFRSLLALNLPRSSMLDTTISGSTKQEGNEGSRLFKIMAKSFSKRWQNGEISNFQYLMHLNTLAGRGYNDLTQYPVFPWVLADYESEYLDLSNSKTFRRLDKPMGCQSLESEAEFRKRFESWDDPEVPKFHYGSHYSSAGIVLFFLLRLPPFSAENQKLQGGQFDHADRLFNSVKDTWLSAAGKGNTSDVKELIPEFFYLPEFLENHFNLDLGEKQSGEKVGDAALPPWARGSAREFIRKHREALECDYVSENLHHWIDLIFGYKQRGKAAEDAVNVFYHYTYEGSVDIDSVMDPSMKSSILAQINHFGQTPKQLFHKPHIKRRSDRKLPPHPLKHSARLVPREIRSTSSPITQIHGSYDKILLAGPNSLLKPRTHAKYISWGFPDRSLRFLTYDQDRLVSTHENLHCGNQIQCAGFSHDGRILVTGGDDTLVSVWRVSKDGGLRLERSLCGHAARVRCLHVSQPYMVVASGSDDRTVILWDLRSLGFVRQLAEFASPVSAVYMNDLNGEIVTGAGVVLAVWSVNGECLAAANASQLPSDSIVCVTSCAFSDWMDTNWYATGHESGAVKVWEMLHHSEEGSGMEKDHGLGFGFGRVEYRLILRKVLKFHKHAVTAVHLAADLKQLLSGDSHGRLVSWTVPEN